MKKSFTLAEVLITLGIIGVVAAMTLPALISKHEYNVRKQQFKKVYSMLQQNLIKTEFDFGTEPRCFSTYSGCSGDCEEFGTLFYKNLKVIKSCPSNALRDGCIPSYKGIKEISLENNTDMTPEEIQRIVNNCVGFSKEAIENNSYVRVLADGTIFITYGGNTWRNSIKLFAVDINGKKKPNKWGHDVFILQLRKTSAKTPIKLEGNAGCSFYEKGGISADRMIIESYK